MGCCCPVVQACLQLWFCLETGSHLSLAGLDCNLVDQAGLELTEICLPLPSRHVPLCQALPSTSNLPCSLFPELRVGGMCHHIQVQLSFILIVFFPLLVFFIPKPRKILRFLPTSFLFSCLRNFLLINICGIGLLLFPYT